MYFPPQSYRHTPYTQNVFVQNLSETPFDPKEGFRMAINGVTQSGEYACIFNDGTEVESMFYVDVMGKWFLNKMKWHYLLHQIRHKRLWSAFRPVM